MEESIKYFVPDISEIRVGYECEMNSGFIISKQQESDIWTPRILSSTDIYNINARKDVAYWVRVLYLTKEQIEAEGWQLKKNIMNDLWFRKDNVNCKYRNNQLLINRIFKTIGKEIADTLFKGECKDINTFRYICKLLNIK